MAKPERSGARSSLRKDAVFVGVCVLVGVVLSFPAAWVWLQLANPPSGVLTKQGTKHGIALGEVQLNQQAGVTLWFLVVGLGIGLLAGLVVGALGRQRGVTTVWGILALCVIAAGLTALLGISVFGPDEVAEAKSAAVGDQITSRLLIGTDLAYLGWPIGGLVGSCLAIVFWPEASDDDLATSAHAASTPPRLPRHAIADSGEASWATTECGPSTSPAATGSPRWRAARPASVPCRDADVRPRRVPRAVPAAPRG